MSTFQIKQEHKERMARDLMRLTPEMAAVMTREQIEEWNIVMLGKEIPTPPMDT